MPFTIDDWHDLIRLLEARPEWRDELRRLVLTDALLSMPEQLAALAAAQQRTEVQVTALSAQVTTLAEAQQRTEAQVAALATAQQRTEVQVTALTVQMTALAEAQQRTEAQVAVLTIQVTELAQSVRILTDDVGELKGQGLEAAYRAKGHAYFSRVIRRPHVLTSDELVTIIEDARDRGALSEAEARELYEADVMVRGKRLADGADVYLVVEVSWGVGLYDVERAVQRAMLLSHTGLATIPVVAGKTILLEAAALAHQSQVWQVTDGRAIPPASTNH